MTMKSSDQQANDEAAFKQTRLDFSNVVYQLTARTPVPGTDGEQLSVVEQVQADVFLTRTDAPPAQAFKTRPPVWIDGTDWVAGVAAALNELAAATGCGNRAKNLTARLYAADGHAYAPADIGPLDRAIHELQQALHRAFALLSPPQFKIAAPCPECGTRHVERDDDMVNVDTLQARDNAVTCQNCGAVWDGRDELHALAAAIREGEESAG